MASRVEILNYLYWYELEQQINKRIIGKKVKDIQFTTNNTYYCAMIIYEE